LFYIILVVQLVVGIWNAHTVCNWNTRFYYLASTCIWPTVAHFCCFFFDWIILVKCTETVVFNDGCDNTAARSNSPLYIFQNNAFPTLLQDTTDISRVIFKLTSKLQLNKMISLCVPCHIILMVILYLLDKYALYFV